MIELKEQLSINDYSGNEVGIINVEVVPCDEVGNEYDERDDVYVDSPQELLGRSIHFVVKINGCRGLPARFTVCATARDVLTRPTILRGFHDNRQIGVKGKYRP